MYAALQETAAGLRSTVTRLHPQVLAQLGLTAGVRELLRQFQSRYDIDVIAELEEVGKPQSQSLLYRAARELLTNVGKHAGATTVRVSLLRRGDRVILTVADDGSGFDPSIVGNSLAEGHIGLGSLLARLDAMGGSMRISTEPGRRHAGDGDVAAGGFPRLTTVQTCSWTESAELIASTRSLASPNSIWVFSRKNSGFCTPA